MKYTTTLALTGMLATTEAVRVESIQVSDSTQGQVYEYYGDENQVKESREERKARKAEEKKRRKEERQRKKEEKQRRKEERERRKEEKQRRKEERERKRREREEKEKDEESEEVTDDETTDEDVTDDEVTDEELTDEEESESSDEEINWTTEARPVSKTCHGSIDRLKNDHTAELFERYMAEDKDTMLYSDVSQRASDDMLWWNQSRHNSMRNSYKSVKNNYSATGGIHYTRVPDLYNNGGSKVNIWGNYDVRPAAIQQGMLGDCWWLASAAALGEWPERVHKLFKDGQDVDTDSGIYEIEMHNMGKPVSVTVDDKLPSVKSYSGSASLINARRSPNKAMWLPILEKAAAKFYGTYEDMHGGWMVESLYQLTGMPTKWFYTPDMSVDTLWRNLKEWNAKDYVVTGAIMCTSQNQNVNRYGAVCQHAYSIIGAQEYNGERLVKVRNPWGSERYGGPWSDSSSKWTTDALSQLGHTKQNDGTYYVPVDKFRLIYNHLQIAYYEDDFIHETTEATLPPNKRIDSIKFQMTNSAEQDVRIGFSQQSARMFMDDYCDSEKRGEHLRFSLYNKSTGQVVTDKNGDNYEVLYPGIDNAWLIFENLPEGEYEVRSISNFYKYNNGNWDFAAESFAEKSGVKLNQI